MVFFIFSAPIRLTDGLENSGADQAWDHFRKAATIFSKLKDQQISITNYP